MRKLASIEILDKLEPIPNADRILKIQKQILRKIK